MKLVEYKNDGSFQRGVGEVVKEGSKFIFIKERNVGDPRVIKLNIKNDEVKYLFGARNKFDEIKGAPRG